MVWKIWQSSPARYTNINLGLTIIAPNHFNGDIEITHFVAAIHELPLHHATPDANNPTQRRKMVLPKVIGYFKMNSAKQINELLGSHGTPVWQRGYYERIIRNEDEYEQTALYIICNPQNWREDEEYFAG
jgi:hypothetical protein